MNYIYFCPNCDQEIQVDHPISKNPEVRCPSCETTMKIRITGGAGVHYKGEGWSGAGKKNTNYLIDGEKDKIKTGQKPDPYATYRDEESAL